MIMRIELRCKTPKEYYYELFKNDESILKTQKAFDCFDEINLHKKILSNHEFIEGLKALIAPFCKNLTLADCVTQKIENFKVDLSEYKEGDFLDAITWNLN